MGTAPSLPSPAPEEAPCDAAAVAARQRSFEFFESLDPGRASRWADYAFFLYKRGGGVERARPVFRAALARCTDGYDYIYGTWISVEDEWSDSDGGDHSVVRELFEEWRARSVADADDGGSDEQGRELLWSRYIFFELEHGGAERVRAVAAAAEAACPRNANVRAECVMAEVRLGDDARARAAFDRALVDFGDDAEWRRQLTKEMRREGAYLSEEWFGGGCLSFCRGWWFRPHRWWEQIGSVSL
jgi:hypothetical protein